MRLFFEIDIEISKSLSEDESRHATKVLRLKNGDDVEVIDGKGNIFYCRIANADSSACGVEIISQKKQYQKPYFLELVIAPTKNMDRVEWLVEKCVEIGVDSFVFIETKNSERSKLRLDRLQKIAISAMKQSKNYFMPSFSELKKIEDVINQDFKGQRFIAHCFENDKKHLKQLLKANSRYQILIGPEGDFTQQEIEKAISKDFTPASLGENRLRTETAALLACAVVSITNA